MGSYAQEGEEKAFQDFLAINGVSLSHVYDEADRWKIAEQRLQVADWLGVQWHRFDLWWKLVEPEKDQFDFSYFDQVVDAVLENNRKLMPILCYGAPWAGEDSPVTPEDQAFFARYVHQMVKRYQDRITHWEIWNEPNITPFWVPRPDPALYASLLEKSYHEAKRADPECKIVGLCTAEADLPFIEGVYEKGAGSACDILSYHHYSDVKVDHILERDIYEIKRIMNRFGDQEKPIWITEMGLPTGAAAGGLQPFTEGEQAVWLIRKHLVTRATGLVERLFWFTINDWTTDPAADGHWGVFDIKLFPKPSAYAYRTMARLLGETIFIGDIWLSPTARCFLFKHDKKGKQLCAVLWTTKEGRETVTLRGKEKKLQLHSLYGSPAVVTSRSKDFDISLTFQPIYVDGLAPSYRQLAELRLSPFPLYLVPGEEKTITLSFPSGRLRYRPYFCGLQIQEERAEGGHIMLKLKAPVEMPLGWHKFSVGFDQAPEGVKDCSRRHPFKVISPFEYRLSGSLPEDVKVTAEVKNVADATLQAKFSWRLLPTGVHESPARGIGKFGPNETHQLEVNLRPTQGERMLQLVGEIEQAPGREFTFERRIAVAPFLTSPVLAIDGELDDWEGIFPVALKQPEQLIRTDKTSPWSPENLSGRVWIGFDAKHLYLAAWVHDDYPLINPFRDGELWRGDALELYLGFDGPHLDHWYGERDFQIGISPGGEGIEPHCWVWKTNQPLSAALIKVRQTADGYQLEARLPLEELGVSMEGKPQLLGFSLGLDDLDDPKGKINQHVLMWEGGRMNWRDPSDWGWLLVNPKSGVR